MEERGHAVYVFELIQPGDQIDGIDDPNQRSDQAALLDLMVNCVADAAVALSWFEASMASPMVNSQVWESKWHEDREQLHRIGAALEAELPVDLTPTEHHQALTEIGEQSRIQVKRERWKRGEQPVSYLHRAHFIHAKSCLYALDTLKKALDLLAKFPEAPAAVGHARSEFCASFPDLRHVRDSSHHAEDRVQGKKRSARIERSGALIIESLHGNRFGGTLADGTFGEVEISARSVGAAQQIVQATLDSYRWIGDPRHLPR